MEDKVTMVRSVCPLDCPDACSLMVEKRNGRIVKVEGNKDHPVTKGVICHKVRKFPERTYHKERVLYPLKRTGKKGTMTFQRISWEEAYDEIVTRFQRVIQTYGSEAILPYSFYGNMGILNSEGMDRRFFHKLGASFLDRTICNSAGAQGFRYTMGANKGIDPEETIYSKLILIWGCNAVSTNLHQVLYANEARKRGAKIVVIDTHRNRTAKWADWFLQIRPGTDAALALGLMHVLIQENLIDTDFIQKYTIGFEELKKEALAYTPSITAKWTGLSEEEILSLARLYGQTTPSFIRIGNGLQHHENGGMAVRAIACLPALTGQWGIRGGGALKGNSGFFPFHRYKIQRPDLHQNPRAYTINMNQLGNALLDRSRPIKVLFVYNSNPAQVAPDQQKVRAGLLRDDLFTVVHDHFLTDTCRYADIVLPATTHFENWDLYKSYWHLYLQLHEPVIPPQGEAKSNFTLFKELAERMGFDDVAFRVTEEEMIKEIVEDIGIDYDELKKKGYVKVGAANNTFPQYIPTPSKKVEFYSERMKKEGLPPVPVFTPIQPMEKKFPLMLISGPNHQFLNSTFGNIAALKKFEGKPRLQIHPKDAIQRGIKTDDMVIVYNQRGRCRLFANVTEDCLKGTAVIQGLWWDDEQSGFQSVNVLTSQQLADMGGGACFFSTFVEVQKESQ